MIAGLTGQGADAGRNYNCINIAAEEMFSLKPDFSFSRHASRLLL